MGQQNAAGGATRPANVPRRLAAFVEHDGPSRGQGVPAPLEFIRGYVDGAGNVSAAKLLGRPDVDKKRFGDFSKKTANVGRPDRVGLFLLGFVITASHLGILQA